MKIKIIYIYLYKAFSIKEIRCRKQFRQDNEIIQILNI